MKSGPGGGRARSEAPVFHRAGRAFFTLCALLLLILAANHVRLTPDALIYLPAYLVFIYLFHQAWRLAIHEGTRERLFVALGLSLSALRYPLLFTPLEPYLDILTVLTFYFFACSQALVLEESRRMIRALNILGIMSAAFYLLLVLDYWLLLALGPRPYLLDRFRIENQVGPVWLLLSTGSLMGFLLYFHLRAALEIDDFAIRLRLGFLILSWLFFLAFFLLDEGVHFGWFEPNRQAADLLLVTPILFAQLGLAMPRQVERFFSSLYFLDRRTSQELTLFVLTRLVRNTTGSNLTELAVATAERLGIGRRERQRIFLACEFLAGEEQTGGEGGETDRFLPHDESDWEDLAVTSAPEGRRLALHQQTVFSAWRLKRAVVNGIRHDPSARLIAACRDYLSGGSASHEPELWRAIEASAAGLRTGRAGGGPDVPEEGKELRRVSMRIKRKNGNSGRPAG